MSFAAHNPTNSLICNYCHQLRIQNLVVGGEKVWSVKKLRRQIIDACVFLDFSRNLTYRALFLKKATQHQQ